MFLDLDNFKTVNDSLGHHAGDELLLKVSQRMKRMLRDKDVLARVGGEEFALVLPGTTLEETMRIADKLCATVEANALTIEGGKMPMTASFGVATISDNDTCMTDIIARADRALYRSKREGRNRVDLESSQMMLAIDGELQPVARS